VAGESKTRKEKKQEKITEEQNKREKKERFGNELFTVEQKTEGVSCSHIFVVQIRSLYVTVNIGYV
jgi:hypothetical protein